MNYSGMRNAIVAAACMVVLFCELPVPAQRYSDWTAPVSLGPTVNTSVNDGCPFISKDNLSLFFASNRNGTFGMNDIYVTQRESEDSVWGTPFNLGAVINSPGNEVCPTFTISGRYLYFVSNRPGGCGGDDIYVSRLMNKKDLTSWDTPVNLGCQFNSSANDITPSLFEDEAGTVYLYFSSNRTGGAGLMDIYVSVRQPDGTFGTPTAVSELNTASDDQRPNIRYRDGLEIFFESNRAGTLGATDLYSSTRQTTLSAWSAPVNLGAVVNSSAVEGRPSLSFDGTELYFMSGRSGGLGSNDIYVTRRSKITRP